LNVSLYQFPKVSPHFRKLKTKPSQGLKSSK
jgi:hypothetical protein